MQPLPPPPSQGLGEIDGEKREVEAQLQELAEEAAKDLGLTLDKNLKCVTAFCFLS